MKNNSLITSILAILLAIVICLVYVAAAADDARLARSFAEHRNKITQQQP